MEHYGRPYPSPYPSASHPPIAEKKMPAPSVSPYPPHENRHSFSTCTPSFRHHYHLLTSPPNPNPHGRGARLLPLLRPPPASSHWPRPPLRRPLRPVRRGEELRIPYDRSSGGRCNVALGSKLGFLTHADMGQRCCISEPR